MLLLLLLLLLLLVLVRLHSPLLKPADASVVYCGDDDADESYNGVGVEDGGDDIDDDAAGDDPIVPSL